MLVVSIQLKKMYFYYYCNDCKLTIKENIIETFISEFFDDIVDYDSVINQFFLPMIKQKVENPKEDIEEDTFEDLQDTYEFSKNL